MKDLERKWEAVLAFSQEKINKTSYDTFLSGLKAVKIDEILKCITLSADIPFIRQIVNERYLHILKDGVSEIFGESYDINIKTMEELRTSKKAAPVVESEKDIILNPKYSFGNFIVGPNNRYAHAAALAVAQNPGEAYNPLFIYAGSGLGKTHLMHAIGMYIMGNYPDKKVLYVSSETFTNEFIRATGEGGNKSDSNRDLMNAFKKKYREVDVLLIDDIQFLAHKTGTQEEFFHTFEDLYKLKKQIVITSDRPANQINDIDERLRSRFQWNLSADISEPEYETRVAILIKKAELEGFEVDDDLREVIDLIAEKIQHNVRDLEGALKNVLSFSVLTGEKVDIRFAKRILRDILSAADYEITPDNIKKVVAKHFGVKVADLESDKRTNNIAQPRHIAVYLCRELTELSLPKIGESFGGRDHTTILYSCNKISKDIKKNEELKETINKLINVINGK